MKPLAVDQPSTIEPVCARAVAEVTVRSRYRMLFTDRAICAGPAVVFFDELGAVLKQLGTYSAPDYITGDFNIRVDRTDDPHSVQFHCLVIIALD